MSISLIGIGTCSEYSTYTFSYPPLKELIYIPSEPGNCTYIFTTSNSIHFLDVP